MLYKKYLFIHIKKLLVDYNTKIKVFFLFLHLLREEQIYAFSKLLLDGMLQNTVHSNVLNTVHMTEIK